MHLSEIYGIFLYLEINKINRKKQVQKLQASVFDYDIPPS